MISLPADDVLLSFLFLRLILLIIIIAVNLIYKSNKYSINCFEGRLTFAEKFAQAEVILIGTSSI